MTEKILPIRSPFAARAALLMAVKLGVVGQLFIDDKYSAADLQVATALVGSAIAVIVSVVSLRGLDCADVWFECDGYDLLHKMLLTEVIVACAVLVVNHSLPALVMCLVTVVVNYFALELLAFGEEWDCCIER